MSEQQYNEYGMKIVSLTEDELLKYRALTRSKKSYRKYEPLKETPWHNHNWKHLTTN